MIALFLLCWRQTEAIHFPSSSHSPIHHPPLLQSTTSIIHPPMIRTIQHPPHLSPTYASSIDASINLSFTHPSESNLLSIHRSSTHQSAVHSSVVAPHMRRAKQCSLTRDTLRQVIRSQIVRHNNFTCAPLVLDSV